MSKEPLEIIYMSIDDLHDWDDNPKLHNEELLLKSIERFGIRQAILVQKSTKKIIAGHGRKKAFREKGYTKVPVMLWDCTDEEATTYAIADNQLTISGGWDQGLLLDSLRLINDVEMLDFAGFDEEELENLIKLEDMDFVDPYANDEILPPKEKPPSYLTTEFTYFYIRLIKKLKRTNIYAVINRNSGEELGRIKWYGHWRSYCFFPEAETIFNSNCMVDLIDFMNDLMEKRKSKNDNRKS